MTFDPERSKTMQNVELEITEDNRLILTVNLNEEISFTTQNRSIRIASTEGNLQLWKDGQPHPKNIRVNLNVFRSLTEAEKKEAEKARRSFF
jgi:hypothetical protein